MPGDIRRVVTGHDANGKAIVLSDGAAPFVHINPLNTQASTDIWRTGDTPVTIVAEHEEPTMGPRRLPGAITGHAATAAGETDGKNGGA